MKQWAVYGAAALISVVSLAAAAEPALEARDALRAKNVRRLDQLNELAQSQQYLLAPWIDYWAIGVGLRKATQPDLDAFYARWPGSYVEDRLRNDWLLELGHRRDWKNFRTEFPRFRMNDDREVTCYALLTEHFAGKDVAERARATWLGQKDQDEGCNLLADTLLDAGKFKAADVWLKLRYSMEFDRPRALKQAGALLGRSVAQAVKEINDSAGRYLTRKASAKTRQGAELTALALVAVAANEPSHAADLLESKWQALLPRDLAAWAWAQAGRQAAWRLQAEAEEYYEHALALQAAQPIDWSEDTLAAHVRVLLRAAPGERRGQALLRAIERLGAARQSDPAYTYWKAFALLEIAPPDPASGPPAAQRVQARALLQTLAGQPAAALHYYGRLAAEDLGQPLELPAAPAPLTDAERQKIEQHPGLKRAIALIELGLRGEGVREWNFSMRGLNDRELLAASQAACTRGIWDRCISASERTRGEFDLMQRYPQPHREALVSASRESGVEPAFVYGMIRQESRFVTDSRSHVGASGLMQLMPPTARWVAKKNGIPYHPGDLNSHDTNLLIGTRYLRMQLDTFDGSQPLATVAYNAGPARSRRWRLGPTLEAAAWVESIPFHETRDYVKNVLMNSIVYASLLGETRAEGAGQTLRQRLGAAVGPASTP
ncbi:MAG TPA: transglycosylase SLT domain-containing protein [Burkholderiaceae bacterium]